MMVLQALHEYRLRQLPLNCAQVRLESNHKYTTKRSWIRIASLGNWSGLVRPTQGQGP
jgi:hypothetical protein